MASSLDSYLGIHTQALALEARRTDVLAANLANADTPNYKARDLDFKSALAAAAGAQGAASATGTSLALAITNPADLTAAGTVAGAAAGAAGAAAGAAGATGTAGTAGTAGADDQAFLKYRVPLAPSLDGNTVDEQLEESAFAENTVRYQATLTFLNVKLRDLLTAIGSQ